MSFSALSCPLLFRAPCIHSIAMGECALSLKPVFFLLTHHLSVTGGTFSRVSCRGRTRPLLACPSPHGTTSGNGGWTSYEMRPKNFGRRSAVKKKGIGSASWVGSIHTRRSKVGSLFLFKSCLYVYHSDRIAPILGRTAVRILHSQEQEQQPSAWAPVGRWVTEVCTYT